jgi:hypothetical protein
VDSRFKTALRKELQHAEDERNRLDVVIEYLRERLRGDDDQPANTAAPESGSSKVKPRRATRSGSRRVTAAAAAEQALRQRGEAMKTAEILAEVQTRGAKMKNAEGLYKTLDRSTKFRRDGRGLWALSEWPEPTENEAVG